MFVQEVVSHVGLWTYLFVGSTRKGVFLLVVVLFARLVLRNEKLLMEFEEVLGDVGFGTKSKSW